MRNHNPRHRYRNIATSKITNQASDRRIPSHMPGSVAEIEMENRLMVAQANEAKSIAQYRVPSRVGWSNSRGMRPH